MKEIILTKGMKALVDDEDFENLNKWKWFASKKTSRKFYAQRNGYNGKTITMHREILNTPQGLVSDHIDGNTLNNQKKNLRICTHAQNLRNKASYRGISRFKGVFWNKVHKKWQASIKTNNKFIYIGLFSNEENAAIAYDRKARELFGEFAKTNFIYS